MNHTITIFSVLAIHGNKKPITICFLADMVFVHNSRFRVFRCNPFAFIFHYDIHFATNHRTRNHNSIKTFELPWLPILITTLRRGRSSFPQILTSGRLPLDPKLCSEPIRRQSIDPNERRKRNDDKADSLVEFKFRTMTIAEWMLHTIKPQRTAARFRKSFDFHPFPFAVSGRAENTHQEAERKISRWDETAIESCCTNRKQLEWSDPQNNDNLI